MNPDAASSTTTVSDADWRSLMQSVPIEDSEMNELVLNYLLVEGYKSAADCFVADSGIEATQQQLYDDDVAARTSIRAAVHAGDVVRGIEQLNDLQPELLDSDQRLGYALQLQRLVELVRLGDGDGAVQLARAELAARAGDSADRLDGLERTMALLAFADVAPDALPEPLRELIGDERRVSTANQLNAAILRAQGSDGESRLPLLLKTIKWCEEELKAAHVAHPTLKDLLGAQFALV